MRQARIAKYRQEERWRRCGLRRTPRAQKYIPPGEEIIAPQKFDLTLGSGNEVVKFLRAVANRVLVQAGPVRLNFRSTQSFAAPAAILVFAELDRIIALAKIPKPITIIDPIQRRPREVLKQIGLYQLSGDKCDIVPEREDVVYWKTTKGATQSGDELKILESVAERVNKDHARHLVLNGVWRGVTEAVANVVDHAYLAPRADGFSGLANTKWWMFTHVREPFFTAAVCDLDCGYSATIKRTLPEAFVAGIRSAFLSENLDSLAIHTAMEFGRSGTHEGHRGKGSRDALSLLRKHGDGELVVLSNTGWMRYRYEQGAEVSHDSGSLNIDIKGTIIWWKLPISGGNNANR